MAFGFRTKYVSKLMLDTQNAISSELREPDYAATCMIILALLVLRHQSQLNLGKQEKQNHFSAHSFFVFF